MILNTMERGLAWQKQRRSPARSVRTATQRELKRPRLPSELPLVLTVGTEDSMRFLTPHSFCSVSLLVKHRNDSVLSASQFFSCPMASLLSLDLHSVSRKFAHLVLQAITAPHPLISGHIVPGEPPQPALCTQLQPCSETPQGPAQALSSCCFLC